MARAVRAALMRLMAPLAVKAHCKEARHTLYRLEAETAALQPLALLLRGAQCLLVLEAQVGRGRRQWSVTVLAAVVLEGTLALGARAVPPLMARLLRFLQAAAAVVLLVIVLQPEAAVAAALASLE